MAFAPEAAWAGPHSLRTHQMESRGHIHETAEGFSGCEQADVKETPQNDGLVSPNYNALIKVLVLVHGAFKHQLLKV